MKGKTSIKDFVKAVRKEILKSVDDKKPLFKLTDIQLEVAFLFDADAKDGSKFYVCDAGTGKQATQAHKVKVSLMPSVASESSDKKDSKKDSKKVSDKKAKKNAKKEAKKKALAAKKDAKNKVKETAVKKKEAAKKSFSKLIEKKVKKAKAKKKATPKKKAK